MTKLSLATDKMIAEKTDGVGWMTFNNPARRNAIGFAMREAILEILADFESDPDVRVIVMRGAGDKAFVSGSDISEFAERRATPEQREIYDNLSSRVGAAYNHIEKPLIAMIQGFCLGGGLGTAMQADLRIASDDSQFGVPAAKLSIGYPFHNMKKIIDVVGPAKTKEIMFTRQALQRRRSARHGVGQPGGAGRGAGGDGAGTRRHHRRERPVNHTGQQDHRDRGHEKPGGPRPRGLSGTGRCLHEQR